MSFLPGVYIPWLANQIKHSASFSAPISSLFVTPTLCLCLCLSLQLSPLFLYLFRCSFIYLFHFVSSFVPTSLSSSVYLSLFLTLCLYLPPLLIVKLVRERLHYQTSCDYSKHHFISSGHCKEKIGSLEVHVASRNRRADSGKLLRHVPWGKCW